MLESPFLEQAITYQMKYRDSVYVEGGGVPNSRPFTRTALSQAVDFLVLRDAKNEVIDSSTR